uniref:Uncharacterized protein n=1 Tax=uncultured beta proteobacterium HF0130_04F21 TaxID=710819 RepID=E0XSS5_9PROT|nr:hypothetical protein [uncultured beta proteobacterium HF0130_04F21]
MTKYLIILLVCLGLTNDVFARKRCLISSKITLLYYERIQSITIWAEDLKDANKKFRRIFPHRTNIMRIICREHINPYSRIQ